MISEMSQCRLYIVISQTGTALSRIIKGITGKAYNHASISLSEDLFPMYSFGRHHPYNPVWGGFVIESPHAGTFKRFSETTAVVLAVPVARELYDAMKKYLQDMYEERKIYHYNYLGLFLAGLHINRKKERCYYCSEFVHDLLLRFHVDGADRLDPVIHPTYFMDLPGAQVVYQGKLREYSKERLLPENT